MLSSILYRSGLEGVRLQVAAGRISGLAVYASFTDTISNLLDLAGLVDRADRETAVGRQQLALDAILRHDEAVSAAGAALFIEPKRQVTVRVVGLASRSLGVEDREETTFLRVATPQAAELYRRVVQGPASTRLLRYLDSLTEDPASSGRTVDIGLLPQVELLTTLSRTVGAQVATQTVDQANRSAARDRWLAGIGVMVAALLCLGATVLVLLVIRSISRPLRRLTASADEVADVAQQELVRVADSDDPEAAVPQLRPIEVGTADEMGELAQAFNRVQQVASSLVERQLVCRQNVATMFGNVGRRTQNGLVRRNGTGGRGPRGSRTSQASPNGGTESPPDWGKLHSVGDGDLVRRVPGAQMPAGARGARPGQGAPGGGVEHHPDGLPDPSGNGTAPDLAERDASAARSLVEEFEAGVQRALRLGSRNGSSSGISTGSGNGSGGDRGPARAETDEEDAR